MAAHAATLATAAVERMSHGRRMGSGTTFSRSAAAVVRIRSRRRAGGGGETTPSASAVAVSPRLASSSRQRAHWREVRLVGLALSSVEGVERVGGGQVVDVHDISSPGSPRSSRNRASPMNMRLLIVPSGWPSRSASSDCVNPP